MPREHRGLFEAVERGDIDGVIAAFEQGADIHAKSPTGRSVLDSVAAAGLDEIARWLVQNYDLLEFGCAREHLEDWHTPHLGSGRRAAAEQAAQAGHSTLATLLASEDAGLVSPVLPSKQAVSHCVICAGPGRVAAAERRALRFAVVARDSGFAECSPGRWQHEGLAIRQCPGCAAFYEQVTWCDIDVLAHDHGAQLRALSEEAALPLLKTLRGSWP